MRQPNPAPAPPEAAAAQLLTQVATGHLLASALQVAVELDIAVRLRERPLTAAELAAETAVQEDGLYRVLRALASVGVFTEGEGRRFALNPAANLLLPGTPGSLRAMARWITSPFHFQVYADLMHSVKTGQPAVEKVTGSPVFAHLAKHPELSETFNDAMTAFSGVVMAAALEAYDFAGIDTLVDVAGGHGAVLTAILKRNPDMKGVLFDLEHVVAGCGPLLEASGVAERVEIRGGDFFESVPEADGYVLKHIVHDWDDERAAQILWNIRTAMGSRKGRVVLLESVLAPGNAPDFSKVIDLEMMAMPGGRERTEKEYRALFEHADFRVERVVPTQSPLSVIEATPV